MHQILYCVQYSEREYIGSVLDLPHFTYDVNQIVLFDRELTNYSGYYNTQTSSFICPLDGIYIFTLVISVQRTNGHVFIMRNDVELTSTWAHTDDEQYNHGTNMVVTECLVGDVVWPKVGQSYGLGSFHSDRNRCSTAFSGVLIKKLGPSPKTVG